MNDNPNYYEILRKFDTEFWEGYGITDKKDVLRNNPPIELKAQYQEELLEYYIEGIKEEPFYFIMEDTRTILATANIKGFELYKNSKQKMLNKKIDKHDKFDYICYYLNYLIRLPYNAAKRHLFDTAPIDTILLQTAINLNNGKKPAKMDIKRMREQIDRYFRLTVMEYGTTIQPYLIYGTSPITENINKLLNNNGNIENINAAQRLIDNKTSFRLEQIPNTPEHFFTITTPNTYTRIHIKNMDKIRATTKGASKLFTYFLYTIRDQSLKNGSLISDSIIIDLHKFIELPWVKYKTVDSAAKFLKKTMEKLKTLEIQGYGKNNATKTITEGEFYLFQGSIRRNSVFEVVLGTRVPWDFICQQYTAIPNNAFSLDDKSFSLALVIAERARTNLDSIQKNGTFQIRNVTAMQYMGLPTLGTSKNPQRDIITPFKKAIEDLEEADKGSCITITPDEDYTTTGKMTIGLRGEYLAYFKNLKQKFNDKQEKAIKRKEKAIREKAKQAKATQQE